MSILNDVRLDGWANAITGMGTSIDRASRAVMQPTEILPDNTLVNLFRGDDLARKIVLKKPKEMCRKGYNLRAASKKDDDKINAADNAAKRLRFIAKIYEARWKARLYGGAILYKVLDGNQEEPIREGERLKSLVVMDRRYAQVEKWQEDIEDPDFGKPLVYRITSPYAFTTSIHTSLLHSSRVIRFEGVETDEDAMRSRHGWGLSVLQEAYEVLQQQGQAWQGVAHGMTEWSQGVMKIKNLHALISAGNEANLQKRMAVVNMSRGIGRAVLVDAESEDFSRLELNFTGIAQVLDKVMMRLSSVAEVPVTILFGRSPAGMNATGESDLTQFYDNIDTERVTELVPHLEDLHQTLFDHGEVDEPDEWSIQLPKLREPTALEQAQIENIHSTRMVNYIRENVLLPEEVALSDFDETSSVVINREIREQALKQLEKDFVAKATEAAEPEEGKAAEAPEAAGDQPTVTLAPTDIAKFLTVNQGLASVGLGPKKLPDGSLDPDGYLTINAFESKQKRSQELLGQAEAETEIKETLPDANIEPPKKAPTPDQTNDPVGASTQDPNPQPEKPDP